MYSKRAAPFPAVTVSFRPPSLLKHLLNLLTVLLAELDCEQPLMIRNMTGIARACIWRSKAVD